MKAFAFATMTLTAFAACASAPAAPDKVARVEQHQRVNRVPPYPCSSKQSCDTACQDGNGEACALAAFYAPVDKSARRSLIQRGCELEWPDACHSLIDGCGPDKACRERRSKRWFEVLSRVRERLHAACAQGRAQACRVLAHASLGSDDEVLWSARLACGANDAIGCYILARRSSELDEEWKAARASCRFGYALGCAELWEQFGEARVRTAGLFDHVVQSLQETCAQPTDSAVACQLLGGALVLNGDLPAAERVRRRACTLSRETCAPEPRMPMVQSGLFVEEHDPDLRTEILSAARRRCANKDPIGCYEWARASTDDERWQGARASCELGFELGCRMLWDEFGPDRLRAAHLLDRVMAALRGSCERAIEADAVACQFLGGALGLAGNRGEAERLRKRACALSPPDCRPGARLPSGHAF